MKTKIIIILMVISIIVGCKKENELKKSVWIADNENPELPAYSEWGYNTFGAYYDRTPFISNDELMPAKVIVTNNVTSFILNGQLDNSYNYYGDYHKMAMEFKIPNFLPKVYTELIALNNTVINLKDTLCQVTIYKDTSSYIAEIIEGEFIFKRVQNLIVDTKPIEVILSGYFDFKALINNEPITVWEGRFDVGVGPDNFYFY